MSLPSQKEGEPERTCLIPLQLPPIYPFPILPHSTFQYTSVLFCFLPSDQQVPPNISIFSIQCNIFLFTNKTLSYKMELFNFTVKSFKVIIRVILSELNIAKWKQLIHHKVCKFYISVFFICKISIKLSNSEMVGVINDLLCPSHQNTSWNTVS